MSTEFAQYEGAILKMLNLPVMVLVQQGVRQRGVFDFCFGHRICQFKPDAGPAWVESAEFKHALALLVEELSERRDIFIGYSGRSSDTADKIKAFLKSECKAHVLDWKTDFSVARTVLEEIAEADRRCGGAIFIFGKDDNLLDGAAEPSRTWFGRAKASERAMPRDNVVFEAGYFIGTKGKSRVLIVREEDTKMPADLGGDIYAALEDRKNIDPIKEILRRFVLSL